MTVSRSLRTVAAWPVEAKRFPVAALCSPHHLASGSGLAVLAAGGNAIDAVVAANLTLGVVAPYYCGYGGDLFALVHDGTLHGYAGAGRAPAGATVEAVAARAGGHPYTGPLSVTVPGAVRGWFDLLGRWGTRPFADLARDAIRYARDGFEVSAAGALRIAGSVALYPEMAAIQERYGAVVPGAVLRQPALARLIEHVAEQGPEAYYRGAIADALAAAVQAQGGLLAASDLAAHAGSWVEPLRAPFDGAEVYELPPPTQGVTALEALRVFDGGDDGPGPGRTHRMIEAAKLALADRDAYVTDPDHMPFPAERLLADAWVDGRRAGIVPEAAGDPGPGREQRGGTAYLCAVDRDGLAVSLIQSNFLGFGSGVHVAEWGVNLQNRGASFSLDARHPNCWAPRKRPLHTLVPALVLRDGAPWLVFGTMGGDTQVQVHLQVLTAVITDGADVQAAIAAPRWRVDPGTWRVRVEPDFPDGELAALVARGHRASRNPGAEDAMGHAHAIEIAATGLRAAFDPRSEGAALGR